ncbi:hypothetical protein [Acinetobacter sp. MD2(2019)]|uniref:hypothetical protein n=1 Tax=Acinetobacter sp. MD2(2019) TaxID=2605273 RepID=UPI002D1EA369|nr:hypothetical protein [Acinetobacter sp. MD2(2019)]MEB3755012.1 hypothetical protein [Acinetobacter sp. MD2(2019)]
MQKQSQYEIWNESTKSWQDQRTAEEKRAAYLATLKNLTRRQFRLTLLDYDLLDTIEQKIKQIEDVKMRRRIQIEYDDATEFSRSSEAVAYMCNLLELDDNQINGMWEHAMQIEI